MQIKTPAKLNIFLKIVGLRGNYHELISRFIRYDALYDTITFVPAECDRFTIEGVEIPREQNILYKAFVALNRHTGNPKIIDFFYHHKVVIEKKIPMGAGLGGGSSNAAGFLKLVNEVLSLKLTTNELATIGAELGADVPFFIYDYPAANVSGIGEVIEPFEDDIPQIELKLISIHCDTAAVYKNYRQKFMHQFEIGFAQQLSQQTSHQILATIAPMKANDLYASAVDLCKELQPFSNDYFLSGSGSTLFRSKE